MFYWHSSVSETSTTLWLKFLYDDKKELFLGLKVGFLHRPNVIIIRLFLLLTMSDFGAFATPTTCKWYNLLLLLWRRQIFLGSCHGLKVKHSLHDYSYCMPFVPLQHQQQQFFLSAKIVRKLILSYFFHSSQFGKPKNPAFSWLIGEKKVENVFSSVLIIEEAGADNFEWE